MNVNKCLPLDHEILHLFVSVLNEGAFVYLEWLPSHVDVCGNEKADVLAEAGLLMKEVSHVILLSVSEVMFVG